MKMKMIRFEAKDKVLEEVLREFAKEMRLKGKRKPYLFMKFYVEPLTKEGKLIVKSETKIKGKKNR